MDKMVPPRFHTRAYVGSGAGGYTLSHGESSRETGGYRGGGVSGSGNPARRPAARGLREHAARLARGRLGVGDHLAGAGPGATLTAPGRGAGQHSLPNLFLRPQTGVYIGIEIDIDRPRFAPSVFLRDIASRLPTP